MSTNERDLIVGGQAVIEGVMMRTPNAYAIAVRKADGTIVNTAAALPKWSDKLPILKLPVLRGSAVLIQSMVLGIKSLNFSANVVFHEAEQNSEVEVVELEVAGLTTGRMPASAMPVAVEVKPSAEKKKSRDRKSVV